MIGKESGEAVIDRRSSWVWWVLSENWLISIREDTSATIKEPTQTHKPTDGRTGGSIQPGTGRPPATDPGLRIWGRVARAGDRNRGRSSESLAIVTEKVTEWTPDPGRGQSH